jgi:hypothetical protein
VSGPTCPPDSKTIECRDGLFDSIEYEAAEPVACPGPPQAVTDSALVAYVETFG